MDDDGVDVDEVSAGASVAAPQNVAAPPDAKSWPVYRTIIHFAVDKASLDQRHPWKTSGSRSSTGTGFYIGQRRIITNCHVIKDATSIRLTRNGQPGAFKGIVLCQSEMCDLALVTVENESFWTNMPTVEFESETPVLGDQVIAVGYPLGAKSVTITRGVVSAVSLADLSLMHRNPRLMRIQIDAAINPGNSGGPVLNLETRKIVGVAFSSIHSAQSMSFIISNAVLCLFLHRFESEKKNEFGLLPETGFSCNELANESQRKYYFRERFNEQNHLGCLVSYVEQFTPAAQLLRVGDVLVAVEGVDVSEAGEVLFRGTEWLPFDYLVTSRPFGDSIRLRVLRRQSEADGGAMTELDIDLPLIEPRPLVSKLVGVDHAIRFVIIGGLVFVRCSLPLLATLEKNDSRALTLGLGGGNVERTHVDEEIILVSDVLSHYCNIGCNAFKWKRLRAVNGVPMLNMRMLATHAARILRKGMPAPAASTMPASSVTAVANVASSSSSIADSVVAPVDAPCEFIELDFHCFFAVERRAAVFSCQAVRDSEAEILSTHRVPMWCSPELL